MLSESIERKFVECFSVDDYEVLSDTGFVDITASNKTIPYQVFELTLDNGISLLCADNHIIFTEDFQEIFAKDSLGVSIVTVNGTAKVISVVDLGYEEHMYDLSVGGNSRYYSNGILSHNTTIVVATILHYAIFNKDARIAMLANKLDQAIEIMDRLQISYEYLPDFLKPGVKQWNVKSVKLDNGSLLVAAASSSSAIRGKSFGLVYLDEQAHIPRYQEFAASVLPVLSSGKNSRLIISSTPNGLNQFYDVVSNARLGRNGYWLKEVPWDRVPGRDEAWKQRVLADLNYDMLKFAQEYELEFQGSSGTLLSGACLKSLQSVAPISSKDGLKIYVEADPQRTYTMNCDVSHGKGLDYSTISVHDITQLPYTQVATFRSNTILPEDFSEIINTLGRYYNQAYCLIENNDIGAVVTRTLWDDFEYDNLISSEGAGRLGKKLSLGIGRRTDIGIRMTTSVKKLGCSLLKLLVEQGQLVLNDADTIGELNTFSKKGTSYAAEEGCHDDCVMPLVAFGWMTSTDLFKELAGASGIKTSDYQENQLAGNLLAAGVYYNGSSSEDELVKFEGDNSWWKKCDYTLSWG
jgi:hypothetical protein